MKEKQEGKRDLVQKRGHVAAAGSLASQVDSLGRFVLLPHGLNQDLTLVSGEFVKMTSQGTNHISSYVFLYFYILYMYICFDTVKFGFCLRHKKTTTKKLNIKSSNRQRPHTTKMSSFSKKKKKIFSNQHGKLFPIYL